MEVCIILCTCNDQLCGSKDHWPASSKDLHKGSLDSLMVAKPCEGNFEMHDERGLRTFLWRMDWALIVGLHLPINQFHNHAQIIAN